MYNKLKEKELNISDLLLISWSCFKQQYIFIVMSLLFILFSSTFLNSASKNFTAVNIFFFILIIFISMFRNILVITLIERTLKFCDLKNNWKEIFNKVYSKIWAFLKTDILFMSVIIFICIAPLFIYLQSVPITEKIAFWGSFLLILILILYCLFCAFINQTVILKNISGIKAIFFSAAIVKKYFWKVNAIFFSIFIITALIVFVKYKVIKVILYPSVFPSVSNIIDGLLCGFGEVFITVLFLNIESTKDQNGRINC